MKKIDVLSIASKMEEEIQDVWKQYHLARGVAWQADSVTRAFGPQLHEGNICFNTVNPVEVCELARKFTMDALKQADEMHQHVTESYEAWMNEGALGYREGLGNLKSQKYEVKIWLETSIHLINANNEVVSLSYARYQKVIHFKETGQYYSKDDMDDCVLMLHREMNVTISCSDKFDGINKASIVLGQV